MITDFRTKKVYSYLKERPYGKVMFIFDHGLGDLINFLPFYDILSLEFPRCIFKIGTPIVRNNAYLHPAIIILGDSFRSMIPYYTHIFRIGYPEPSIEERNQGLRKPYLCNIKEMGIPNFIWKPYRFNTDTNNNGIRKIGIHFTGSTNPNAKNIDFEIIEKIWREIEECSYIPIEVHMNCSNTMNRDYPKFINKTNSLRFEQLNLKLLIEKIKECKFFFGIDSGPFYLATALLGTDRCIFLENRMKLDWYFPYPIKTIDTKIYKYGMIKHIIQTLQG